MIYGIGIDIIEVPRIEKQLSRDDRFRNRLFTEREIVYCQKKRFKAQNYAARFAAKEALLKAMGTGLRGRMSWKDIEVVTNESGKPEIRVAGETRRIIRENGVRRIHVSMAHVKDAAMAVVVLEA